MSGPDSAKVLLKRHNKERYQRFILNQDETLILPAVSNAPGISLSIRKDEFKKRIFPKGKDHHLKFISKNDHPHAMIWQTHASQLKKAVRWGIIQPQSVTGRIIAKLGKSRAGAYAPITRGMLPNSFPIRIKLLDLVQDRFEALQELESLVNKENNVADYQQALDKYIAKLTSLCSQITKDFTPLIGIAGLDQNTLDQLEADLKESIERAKQYKNPIEETNLRAHNRARGRESVLEFVKQEMIHGLYELQGINQDNTFMGGALTRGVLNDLVEDSFKIIRDHEPDLRNAVTAKHHGDFATTPGEDELVSYDFSQDNLSPQQQREIVTSISFLEGWDKVNAEKQTVINHLNQEEKLSVFKATRWQTHRSFTAFLKSTGYFIYNMFKGIFLPTRPWEEETWENKEFHLYSSELRQQVPANIPLWQQPLKLFKAIGYFLIDLFAGARDFGNKLAVQLPGNLANDWESTKELPEFQKTFNELNAAIESINSEEAKRLEQLLKDEESTELSQPNSTLADIEYDLESNEQNDILNVMTRGLNQATDIFTHNIYTKDPIGGIVFSAAFVAGAGALLAPTATAAILGTNYVNWFTTAAYKLGSTKFAAAISGGSTQAQVIAGGLDSVNHGPNSVVFNTLHQFAEDPLTISAYTATAYGIGYLLVNGVNGYTIPWLSEYLKEDLGSAPETGYPFVGAKFALLLYEMLVSKKIAGHQDPKWEKRFAELAQFFEKMPEENQKEIKKSALALWLSQNAKTIPKLNQKQLLVLSIHIDSLFTREESASLKKILYPHTPHSIAYQLVAIPLTYIPAILRVFICPFFSLFALARGKKNPLAPMQRSVTDLFTKVQTDLSRLITVGANIMALVFNVATILFKTLAYVVTMLIGRIAALFGQKPAHAIHKFFAAIHVFVRDITETLSPTRALKAVTVAHPTHTIKEIEARYLRHQDKEEEDQFEDAEEEFFYDAFEDLEELNKAASQTPPVNATNPPNLSFPPLAGLHQKVKEKSAEELEKVQNQSEKGFGL
ncbi:MAG: hypothetical protein EPN84_07775 [Legionella sp.]|nr:MAG: hypothetical protein EPN84_07775 [Legionella sp.]